MIEIRPFTRDAAPEDLRELERSFSTLYAHLDAMGLSARLSADGPSAWTRSIQPMLGKLTHVIGAWNGPRLCGFVAGTLRTLPPHLGGLRIGALTHIHVDADMRGTGTGRRLFEALAAAFGHAGVDVMETDVLPRNTDSLAFFEKLGFRTDHLILRRTKP